MGAGVAPETIRPLRISSVTGCREDPAMWQDLAALTPPLVVALAFLIGLAMVLRSQMSPKRRAERNARRRSDDDRP